MINKNALMGAFAIGAIILGMRLLREFDFQTFRFEKPVLAIVYFIGFIIFISLIVKTYKNK